MMSLKQLYLRTVLIAAMFISTLTAGLLFTTSTVYAAESESCAIKIEIDKCKSKTSKDCKNSNPDRKDDCIRKIASEDFKDVNDKCKDKKRPQACHKALEKDCKSKSGGDKSKCEDERASDFKGATAPSNTNGGAKGASAFGNPNADYQCGNTSDAVETKFNLGCLGESAPRGTGPIYDLAYSAIRFLSAGVGLVLVGAMILAGIQYSASQGSPEATQASKNRIQNVVIGLVVYIFAFAFIQYLVPGGVFS